MRYIQGFIIPVPHDKKEAYRDLAAKAAPMFLDYGALEIVECWGEDVKAGKVTDFFRAVAAEEGENVVFSWIVWPDRATCDAAAEKMVADDRMKPEEGFEMPFDGKRMVYGGFAPIFETKAG
jgi:uncharacterized protein YbaA (DUF1428 family)